MWELLWFLSIFFVFYFYYAKKEGSRLPKGDPQVSDWFCSMTYYCVRGSRSCTCQERHAKDMLTFICWRAKYGETVQRIFTSWFSTYCIYICFFYLMQVPRSSLKVFITMFCFCLAAEVVQVNTPNNIQYLWLFLYIKIKYSWKSIIVS